MDAFADRRLQSLLFLAGFGRPEGCEPSALVLALGVLVIRAKQGRLAVAGIVDYTFAVIGAWFSFSAHFAHLITKDLRLTQDSLAGKRLLALL